MIRRFAAVWGILGVSLLLGSAVYRLSAIALASFSHGYRWFHWAALVIVVAFMAHAEGYRGFQLGFSPRVAARARYLFHHANLGEALLAPFFCMGFFRATRRRMITSWALTTGIVLLILAVRLLPQPWRGIVDFGVVVGLAWGLASLAYFTVRAFTSSGFEHSPEVPDPGDHP